MAYNHSVQWNYMSVLSCRTPGNGIQQKMVVSMSKTALAVFTLIYGLMTTLVCIYLSLVLSEMHSLVFFIGSVSSLALFFLILIIGGEHE